MHSLYFHKFANCTSVAAFVFASLQYGTCLGWNLIDGKRGEGEEQEAVGLIKHIV